MNDLAGKTVLVTGASGMLAADLVPQLQVARAKIVLADLQLKDVAGLKVRPLDICNPPLLRALMADVSPDWIVNCAAYTAVDQAEKDYDVAFRVNAMGVANLATAAKERSVPLVHISTDYVFGGKDTTPIPSSPLTEESPLRPCGIYGHSKRYGEELLKALCPTTHLLVRTSWLHGVNGPNFIDTMLKLGKERPSLRIVDDQRGSPTWTGWLASVIVKLMGRNARGTFHATSRGGITWYDFAREIFRQAKLSVDVQPQTSEELGRPAPRPPYSVLDVTKLERFIGETCISWQDGIANHLAARGEAETV